MSAPIAIQLYTVRDALTEDFAGVVKRIADIGYVGVEPAVDHLGATPEEAGRLFKDLGLAVPSAHTPLPLGERKNEVLDTMAALGCKCIASGKGPDDFATMDKIKRTCDLFNEANGVAAEAGLTFGIHNHWWEFQQVEGQYVYRVMPEWLDPDVFFEIDTYWVKTAGPDPAEVVRTLGKRVPLLHIKDGPAVRDAPQVAVGDGVMDFSSIVAAGAGSTEWMIVELDSCATDMMEAVEKSYHYLVTNGLAYGTGS
jgi:sugar phosphate isomerase/epimerase